MHFKVLRSTRGGVGLWGSQWPLTVRAHSWALLCPLLCVPSRAAKVLQFLVASQGSSTGKGFWGSLAVSSQAEGTQGLDRVRFNLIFWEAQIPDFVELCPQSLLLLGEISWHQLGERAELLRRVKTVISGQEVRTPEPAGPGCESWWNRQPALGQLIF